MRNDRSRHLSWSVNDLEYLGNSSPMPPDGSSDPQSREHVRLIGEGWLHYDRTWEGTNVYRHDDHRDHLHVSRSGDILMVPPKKRKFL
jgi:hypothetical protein